MPNRRTRETSHFTEEAKRLAASIKESRKLLDLTQEALARDAGIALNTLRNIESGRAVEPGYFTIRRIAGVLGLKLDDLV